MKKILAVLLLSLAGAAFAQPYPTKPVRVIVAFAPGGPIDVVARLLAPRMSEILGEAVVVENRPSTTGALGTVAVKTSAADGYTILANSSAFAVTPSLTTSAGYDPVKDFAPIAQVATQPNVIVVNTNFPAKTLKELIAIAKKQKLAYASPGAGTTPHLTAEHLFKVIEKLDIVHIPHKGAGPAAAAIVGGEPPIGSLAVTSPLPHIRSGRMRGLAISSAKRHPQLPDVPTFIELGYPQIQDYTWVGLFAPAGTPPEIVQKLNDAVNRALQDPNIRARLDSLTFEAIGGSPQQFADYLKVEVAKWAKVVKETGAKVD